MALAVVGCLSFYQSAHFALSFPLVLSSKSHSFPLLFLLLCLPSYIFLECRRRRAAGRLRRRLGSGGAATTPGTALGPGGCHGRGNSDPNSALHGASGGLEASGPNRALQG